MEAKLMFPWENFSINLEKINDFGKKRKIFLKYKCIAKKITIKMKDILVIGKEIVKCQEKMKTQILII
ncbi:MAG: hypothetical protein K6D38_09740 [Pseudobutyrivibrio sp.]|nr:hypothetical protein [Pseudobutyrivibrio sp.]